MAATTKYGTNYADVLINNHIELVSGMAGDDILLDGGKYGQVAADSFFGGTGHDHIRSRWGSDYLSGSSGNDILVSRSDAGEPAIAQNPALAKFNAAENLTQSNDTLDGGIGSDTFLFRLDLNARPEIIAKHTNLAGQIDWEGVAGENDAPHLHWVEGIGTDTIKDFYRDEGDRIVIEGHTVAASIAYADSNGDGRNDTSIITLTSDQGGAGSHQGDVLGIIRVSGDLVTMEDLTINTGVHHGVQDYIDDALAWSQAAATGGDDVLRSGAVNARILAGSGNDTLIDGGVEGDADVDVFNGGNGNDVIRSHWGKDVLRGGDGDDILVSRSDAGEPVIRQQTDFVKPGPEAIARHANDILNGGLGADTFYFRLDIDARQKIITKHSEPDGHIHWHDVAGENRAPHLHWVESIGTDTIEDFYKAEGDRIVIEGHTVQLFRIQYKDSDGDGRSDYSLLTLRSNQGGAGAHHGDIIGYIKVFGDKVLWDDVQVNAAPTFGVASTLDDFAIT